MLTEPQTAQWVVTLSKLTLNNQWKRLETRSRPFCFVLRNKFINSACKTEVQ
jgi:hypothetical protein